jgi:hypothetical protein
MGGLFNRQGRKVFTLQTVAPMAEQGLATGCAFILPILDAVKHNLCGLTITSKVATTC